MKAQIKIIKRYKHRYLYFGILQFICTYINKVDFKNIPEIVKMSEERNADQQMPANLYTNGAQRKRKSRQLKFTVSSTPKIDMRFMPTYRMQPIKPLNKEICQKIIKTVMDKTFEGFTYFPKSSLQLCAEVSADIKTRVKSENFDRYRYIVIVSIGEKLMQGLFSLVNFLWDAENDGYLSYVVDTPKFFAVATLYYIYYD